MCNDAGRCSCKDYRERLLTFLSFPFVPSDNEAFSFFFFYSFLLTHRVNNTSNGCWEIWKAEHRWSRLWCRLWYADRETRLIRVWKIRCGSKIWLVEWRTEMNRAQWHRSVFAATVRPRVLFFFLLHFERTHLFENFSKFFCDRSASIKIMLEILESCKCSNFFIFWRKFAFVFLLHKWS